MQNSNGLGHRERLRQRARDHGLEGLRPHEIIELALFCAVPRQDVADTARALLERFGTVGGVFAAGPEALLSVPGVTRNMADWIMLTHELESAYADVEGDGVRRVICLRELRRLVLSDWREAPAPCCRAVYTDQNDMVVMRTELCDSLHWADERCVEEIMRDVVALHARCVFLVLYTGIEPLEMFPEERESLQVLAQALRIVNAELMDCVMVGEAGIRSLWLDGDMEQIRQESTQRWLHERYGEEQEETTDGQDRPIYEGQP